MDMHYKSESLKSTEFRVNKKYQYVTKPLGSSREILEIKFEKGSPYFKC